MTKAEAGRLGGLATVKKHGKEHMAAIGRIGAQTTQERYILVPAGTSQYAMVNRQTRKVVAIF